MVYFPTPKFYSVQLYGEESSIFQNVSQNEACQTFRKREFVIFLKYSALRPKFSQSFGTINIILYVLYRVNSEQVFINHDMPHHPLLVIKIENFSSRPCAPSLHTQKIKIIRRLNWIKSKFPS